MSIKLIASDMDGTLLNRYGEVSPGNRAAIRAASEKGVQFCFSTGRSSPGVEPFAHQLELGTAATPYLILSGGANLRKVGDTALLRDITMPQAAYEEIRALAWELGVGLLAYTDTVAYTENTKISLPMMRELSTVRLPLEYADTGRDDSWYAGKSFVKLQFCGENETIQRIYPLIPKALREKYSVIWTNPYCIEVADKHATKGEALAHLAGMLGVSAGEVMAVGDHTNDLSMIQYAGTGVAVANANDDLLKAADVVVADNDHDGVAEAIRRYVL